MVQWLDAATGRLMERRAKGLDARLERLVKEKEHDAFDSDAFELIAGARYLEANSVSGVEFIKEEPGRKTPDLLVEHDRGESVVECKKVDRAQNFSVLIRDAVRDQLNEVIAAFRERGESVLAEVTFHIDPRNVVRSRLVEACRAAIENRTPIIEPEFTVTAAVLPRFKSTSYWLFPSPAFSWERYKFRIRSDWFGCVHQFFGSHARVASLPAGLRGGNSSWIDELDWDCAIKWKISSDEIVSKYRRFAFRNIFDGLEQLKDRGINSCLHLWLETDYSTGSRQSSLVDLFNRIAANARDVFGWLVINETLFDISPKGHFDLIEHAHMIRGPSAVGDEPIVSGMFAPPVPLLPTGAYGVGHELPDIDED